MGVCVSVLIPTFNSEKTIRETLDSALSQTFGDLEVVVVDDGSSDKTVEIVRAYESSRVRLISRPHNLGVGAARNALLESATGTYGAWLDADDLWKEWRLEAMMEVVKGAQDIIVADNMELAVSLPDGRLATVDTTFRRYGIKADGATVEMSAARFVAFRAAQVLFPLSLSRAAGLSFNADFGEDTEFILDLMLRGCRLVYLARPGYVYRQRPDSLAHRPDAKQVSIATLDRLLAKGGLDGETRVALEKRRVETVFEVQYQHFVEALRKLEVKRAARFARKTPSVLSTFIKRMPRALILRWRVLSARIAR